MKEQKNERDTIGAVIIRNITEEKIKAIIDDHYGSCVWKTTNQGLVVYPDSEIEVVYFETPLTYATKPPKGDDND